MSVSLCVSMHVPAFVHVHVHMSFWASLDVYGTCAAISNCTIIIRAGLSSVSDGDPLRISENGRALAALHASAQLLPAASPAPPRHAPEQPLPKPTCSLSEAGPLEAPNMAKG